MIDTSTERRINSGYLEIPESRIETAEQALRAVKRAYEVLGLSLPKFPKITVDFREYKNDVEIKQRGRTEIASHGVTIPFDKRLLEPEEEALRVREMRKKGETYPGVAQTLVHEIGHIGIWSIMGSERSPSSKRLLDEGFASLIEHTGIAESTLEKLVLESKNEARATLNTDSEILTMFLDPEKTPDTGEEAPNTNAAEYVLGRTFLLWIHEIKGSRTMTEMLKQTPSKILMTQEGSNTELNPDFKNYLDRNQKEVTLANAREWEGECFKQAILDATGLSTLKEVETEFRKWIT
ncbi:MAG: hypothetical protein WCJ29_04760 [bacterium]